MVVVGGLSYLSYLGLGALLALVAHAGVGGALEGGELVQVNGFAFRKASRPIFALFGR